MKRPTLSALAFAAILLSGAVESRAQIDDFDPLICEYQGFPRFCFMETGIRGVQFGHAAWGDVDIDGDQDIVIMGNAGSRRQPITFQAFYRNDGEQVLPGPPQPNGQPGAEYSTRKTPFFQLSRVATDSLLWDGANAFGDYNGDGFLDLAVTGVTSLGIVRTDLYRNAADSSARFIHDGYAPGLRGSSIAWGDADGDGDLDLAMLGADSLGNTVLWIATNNAGSFAVTDTGLPGAEFGRVVWGDDDNDGDLDLLVSGIADTDRNIVNIYRNNGGTFTTGISLDAALFPSADWGDYDGDGDLDVAVSGGQLDPFVASGVCRIYRNDGGSYTEVVIADGAFHGTTIWVDFDADGDLDVFASGGERVSGERLSLMLRNDGGTFTRADWFGGGLFGDAALGDYDADGDVDLLLLGLLTAGGPYVQQYRNEIPNTNQAPSTPTLPVATPTAGGVVLTWGTASDDQTAAPSLTYNVRVGTAPGANDVVPSHADQLTGRRLVTARGNADHNLSLTVLNLAPGTYYWAVQAIDASGTASPFTAEQPFVIP